MNNAIETSSHKTVSFRIIIIFVFSGYIKNSCVFDQNYWLYYQSSWSHNLYKMRNIFFSNENCQKKLANFKFLKNMCKAKMKLHLNMIHCLFSTFIIKKVNDGTQKTMNVIFQWNWWPFWKTKWPLQVVFCSRV